MLSSTGEWRYVVPNEGDAHRSPPETPLVLKPDVPEGVELDLDSREHDLSFAQIRYGEPSSVRIAVAIDRRAGKEPVLYVDAHRKRTLVESDRVAGKDGKWETTLEVAVGEGAQQTFVPRRVSFRLGETGLFLAYATLGYLEGEVEIDGRACACRRVDADGNGFATDAGDRVWIDLDHDGRWSPFDEQFLFAPILIIAGTRYALRSDRLGAHLSLEKIEGVGRVRLRLPDSSGAIRKDIRALRAVLVGKDGSAIGVDGHDVGVEAPIGDYRVSMVTVVAEDAKKGEAWSFVFSGNDRDHESEWRSVARDADVAVDPVGELDFAAGLDFEADSVHAGDKLVVRPLLHTHGGLLINSCARGSSTVSLRDHTVARTLLVARDGTVLDQATSGFA